MNAFQIQQSLAGMPYVSIPWIQREFGLTLMTKDRGNKNGHGFQSILTEV